MQAAAAAQPSETETETAEEAATEETPAEETAPAVQPVAEIASAISDAARPHLPFLIALVLALPPAVLILRRRIVLGRRRKLFVLADTNRAARGIYVYMTRLAKYGLEISAEAEELAEKAQFSQHRLSEEERRRMRDLAEAQVLLFIPLYREKPAVCL